MYIQNSLGSFYLSVLLIHYLSKIWKGMEDCYTMQNTAASMVVLVLCHSLTLKILQSLLDAMNSFILCQEVTCLANTQTQHLSYSELLIFCERLSPLQISTSRLNASTTFLIFPFSSYQTRLAYLLTFQKEVKFSLHYWIYLLLFFILKFSV